MKKLKLTRFLRGLALLNLAFAIPTVSEATPYASGLLNESGTVSFFLNEDADNVAVVFNNGAGGTNTLGALPRGKHSFTATHSVYRVEVSKASAAGYKIAEANGTNAVALKISADTDYYMNFEQPRGLRINKNPGSRYFGRLYVGNARNGTAANGRIMENGVYMVNPDYTSAHEAGLEDYALRPSGWALPNGATSAVFPYNIHIGPDDSVYATDWSDNTGNLWVTDPTCQSSGTAVLKFINPFGSAVCPVGADNTHGSIPAAHIEGSVAGGDLVVWTNDEDLQSNKTITNRTELNSIWRYDIGNNALPYQGDATKIWTASGKQGINFSAQTIDMVRGTNGCFYVLTLRSSGNESGLTVVSNGVGIWNSWDASQTVRAGNDLLANSRRLAVSYDNQFLAVVRATNNVWVVPMVNGLPNLSQRKYIKPFGDGSVTMDGVEFDAAGNLYVVSRTSEYVAVYSPGGTTTAVTSSEGTFGILSVLPQVTVTASIPTATEGGSAGKFTLSRTGTTTSPLTVSFTIGGTATSGSDYVTISTNATIPAGAATVDIAVTPAPDTVAELVESVNLNLALNENYEVSSPSSASVSIVDNEPAEVSISTVQSRLLEGASYSRASYQLTRLGLTNAALSVPVSYAGAANGVDFTGPSTVQIPAGAATVVFELAPGSNNNTYAGNKIIVASLQSGTGFTATGGSASVTLIDDEAPVGPVQFSDPFTTDTSANWQINRTVSGASGSDTFADFAWDYNTFGIPVAPSTTDGSTKGLRLRVNANGTFLLNAAINVSPAGYNFTGDYRMKFDMWLNYNGPMFQGGSASTLGFVTGIGTSGTNTQIPKIGSDGIMFKTTNDGQDGANDGDYSAYTNGTLVADASGVYPAGTTSGARNNLNTYYNVWAPHGAPPAQIALYPVQGSSPTNTEVGTIGMAWHSVVVSKIGDVVTWSIDGVPIANLTNSVAAPIQTTGNVFVGWYDPFGTTAPELCFAVVDNFRVEGTAVVAPTLGISRSGNSITLTWTGSYTLQQASALTGSPSDWSNIAGSSGVVINASSGNKFYRLVSNP